MFSINRNTDFFAVFLEFRKYNQCLSTSDNNQYKKAFIGWAEFIKYHLWCVLDEKISTQAFSFLVLILPKQESQMAQQVKAPATKLEFSPWDTHCGRRESILKCFSLPYTQHTHTHTHTYTNIWMNKCMKFLKWNKKHVGKCWVKPSN